MFAKNSIINIDRDLSTSLYSVNPNIWIQIIGLRVKYDFPLEY